MIQDWLVFKNEKLQRANSHIQFEPNQSTETSRLMCMVTMVTVCGMLFLSSYALLVYTAQCCCLIAMPTFHYLCFIDSVGFHE